MASGYRGHGSSHSLGDLKPFFLRMAGHADLKEAERAVITELLSRPKIRLRPGESLFRAGELTERAYVICDGWACWEDIRPDGSRQIMDFYLPGDTVGLDGMVWCRYLKGELALNPLQVSALTEVTAVPVTQRAFERLEQTCPDIATLLLSVTFLERSDRFRRRLQNFGRRSARAKTADLLVELWERQHRVGGAEEGAFPLGTSQGVMAEFLCLAPAYLSRLLTSFEAAQIITVRPGGQRSVVIHDMKRLRTIAMDEGRHPEDS